jgi:hypothetical protein
VEGPVRCAIVCPTVGWTYSHLNFDVIACNTILECLQPTFVRSYTASHAIFEYTDEKCDGSQSSTLIVRSNESLHSIEITVCMRLPQQQSTSTAEYTTTL